MYVATHTFSSLCTLEFSLCLSFYLPRTHVQLWENRAGSREGLAAMMKDSDEGAVVKYTVDVIYLLMEETHHTNTLSFKFVFSQRKPSIGLDQKHTFTRQYGSNLVDHTTIHTSTNKHIVTLSLHLSLITLPIPWRHNLNKAKWAHSLLIISSSHVFLCSLITYYWVAMSGSLTPVRFLPGKVALGNRKAFMMSDVTSEPYQFRLIADHYVLCLCTSTERWCLPFHLCINMPLVDNVIWIGWLAEGLFSVGLYSGARHTIQRMGPWAATHFIWGCITRAHTHTLA